MESLTIPVSAFCPEAALPSENAGDPSRLGTPRAHVRSLEDPPAQWLLGMAGRLALGCSTRVPQQQMLGRDTLASSAVPCRRRPGKALTARDPYRRSVPAGRGQISSVRLFYPCVAPSCVFTDASGPVPHSINCR